MNESTRKMEQSTRRHPDHTSICAVSAYLLHACLSGVYNTIAQHVHTYVVGKNFFLCFSVHHHGPISAPELAMITTWPASSSRFWRQPLALDGVGSDPTTSDTCVELADGDHWLIGFIPGSSASSQHQTDVDVDVDVDVHPFN